MKSRLLSLLCLASATVSSLAADRPNIVFIFTDDHCEQALSAYDPSRMTTPNMDRLAKEGMLFNRCYVTNAICGPSRAVILTGKYSHLNGFMTNGNSFNGDQQTFPKLLQKVGYQTAVLGKWHLKTTPQGFDHFQILPGQGAYYNPAMRVMGKDGKEVPTKVTGYTTDIITDLTLDWLKEKRDASKPFMVMCQHKAPHRNWQPGPDYLKWLDDKTIPEPDTLYDDYKGRTSAASGQTMEIKRHLNANDLKLNKPRGLNADQLEKWNAAYGPKNEAFEKAKATMSEKEIIQWKYQRYVKDYLRCVKSVDDGIGRILDYLDESGLAKNTIVIYSSDQGWYLGEHGWYDKRWMYEESLRTPLLVRWPGTVKAGSRNEDIVSNLDFAETFLDVAGVKVPSDMQGRSIVPLLKGEAAKDWRKSFYYHYYEFPGAHSVARHYGVTNGHHKLIHFYQKKEWELFDLKKDPNEMTSVHGDPNYAAVQKEMEIELARLRKEFKVPEVDPSRPKRQKKPKAGKKN
ncbi:sulfatase [bacterium]|jgi:arylsulfatase A-like enzyme|nr:sulfatase [bacterium]